jgi:hypothetical protein
MTRTHIATMRRQDRKHIELETNQRTSLLNVTLPSRIKCCRDRIRTCQSRFRCSGADAQADHENRDRARKSGSDEFLQHCKIGRTLGGKPGENYSLSDCKPKCAPQTVELTNARHTISFCSGNEENNKVQHPRASKLSPSYHYFGRLF